MIEIKFGAKIPLEITLNTSEADKYVKAKLINLKTGDLIQDDIILAHLSNGLYSNFAISMPAIPFVKVLIFIFENDETTLSLTTPQKYEDIFALDVSLSGGGRLKGKISESILVGKLKPIEEIKGMLEIGS